MKLHQPVESHIIRNYLNVSEANVKVPLAIVIDISAKCWYYCDLSYIVVKAI